MSHAGKHQDDAAANPNSSTQEKEERSCSSCGCKTQEPARPYKKCCCVGCCSIWGYIIVPSPICIYRLQSERVKLRDKPYSSVDNQKLTDAMTKEIADFNKKCQKSVWMQVLLNFALWCISYACSTPGGIQQAQKQTVPASVLTAVGSIAGIASLGHLLYIWAELRKEWKGANPDLLKRAADAKA